MAAAVAAGHFSFAEIECNPEIKFYLLCVCCLSVFHVSRSMPFACAFYNVRIRNSNVKSENVECVEYQLPTNTS